MALLSRAVGPKGVGQWSMIAAVAMFFYSLFIGWTQAQAVRFGRAEWLNSRRLSDTWASRWPLLLFGFALSTFLLAFSPCSFFERLSSLPCSWWPLPLIYLLGLWWLSEAQILLQTTGKFAYLAVLPLIPDILIVAFLSFVLLSAAEDGASVAIIGMVALTTLVAVVVWAIEFVQTRSWGGHLSIDETLRVTSYGLPVAVTGIFGYFSEWGDHLLLQYFHGIEQVGLFQAGYQAMIAMMALAAPLSTIFLPKLVDQLRLDPNAETDYLRRIVPVVSTFWLLAIVPCIAVIPWIFSGIFGEKFQDAQPALLVLCIAVPGAIFSNLYSVLFNIQGRSGQPALFHGAMTVANFVISLGLVPYYGILGAAVGTAISYLLIQLLYMQEQHRYMSVAVTVPALLFLIACIFGIMQCAIGERVLLRLALAIACMGTILFLARRYRITEASLVSGMLPRRLSRLGNLLDRILTKA